MTHLIEFLKTADELERAATVTVAGSILRSLRINRQGRYDWIENRGNYLAQVRQSFGRLESAIAAAEGWQWLICEGLIVQRPDRDDGWVMLTSKGLEADASADLKTWAEERQMPDELLHLKLRGPCLTLFRQGMFDTAVFEAFKTLEVEIRSAAALGNDLVGTKLASRAFDPKSGPLTDMQAEEGEKVALLNLMCGAIGSYKNPQSHRHVGVGGTEGREMIIMASHLLKIVDTRRS